MYYTCSSYMYNTTDVWFAIQNKICTHSTKPSPQV